MFVDIIIVLLILASAIFGLYVGLVKFILHIIAWYVSFKFAWTYTKNGLITSYLQEYIKQEELVGIASFCILFVGALIALSIVVFLIHKLFEKLEISGVNRALGLLFGTVVGTILCAIIIMGCVYINLTTKSFWQESRLVDHFIPLTDYIHNNFIPDDSKQYVPRQKPVSSQSLEGL